MSLGTNLTRLSIPTKIGGRGFGREVMTRLTV